MNKDPLFQAAVKLLAGEQKVKISFLQRKLKLGYPTASMLMKQLEAAGIVSPCCPGERAVLISNHSDG